MTLQEIIKHKTRRGLIKHIRRKQKIIWTLINDKIPMNSIEGYNKKKNKIEKSFKLDSFSSKYNGRSVTRNKSYI